MKNFFVQCLCFSAVLVLFGCAGHDDTGSVAPDEGRGRVAARYWTHVGNASNPYDVVGRIHNACLDYVAARRLADTSMNSGASLDAAYAFFRDSSWFRLTNGERMPRSFLEYGLPEGGDYLDRLVTTVRQQEWFARLDRAVEDTAIADPVAELSRIEEEILLSGADAAERGFPLLYTAVMKYSAAYWLADDGEAWPAIRRAKQGITGGAAAGGRVGSGIDRNTFGQIVKADANGSLQGAIAGFVGGGVYGGIAGSIGGPPGTLAGAAGGAIIGSLAGGVSGAVGGSLKRAIDG